MNTKKIVAALACLFVFCVVTESRAWIAEGMSYGLSQLGLIISAGGMQNSDYRLESGSILTYVPQRMSGQVYAYAPHEGAAPAEALALTVTEPEENAILAESVVTIRGSVNRTDAVVTVNGMPVEANAGSFQYITGIAFGETLFVVRAEVPSGECVEIVRTVTREVGTVETAVDAVLSIAERSSVISDFSATVHAVDLLHEESLLGATWSHVYVARDRKMRTEMYDDADMNEAKIVTVINGFVQQEKEFGIDRISQVDLSVFSGLSHEDMRKVDYEFDTERFINGHELVLDSVDTDTQQAWVSATPLFTPAPYEKIRLCVNWEEGLVYQCETFYEGQCLDRTQVLAVATIDNVVMPRLKKKTLFLPMGEHVTTFVYDDILINQGLTDSLFVLNE